MIIDACTYFGEKEMLDFRMAILDPVVDCFIVVENAWTFQGRPREQALKAPPPKVKAFYRNFRSDDAMEVEWMQRLSITEACAEFDDKDLLIMADVDEIPSREQVEAIKTGPLPRNCPLDMFYYRLNHKRPELCGVAGSTIGDLRRKGVKALFRSSLDGAVEGVSQKGWHLSYFGGTEAIKTKLQSFGHAQFNKPEFLDNDWLEECQRDGKGLLKCGTVFSRVGRDFFPDYFLAAAPKGWWL